MFALEWQLNIQAALSSQCDLRVMGHRVKQLSVESGPARKMAGIDPGRVLRFFFLVASRE